MAKSLFAFLSIPLLGYLVSTAILEQFNTENDVKIEVLCTMESSALLEIFNEDSSVVVGICNDLYPIFLTQTLSIYSAIAAVLLLLLFKFLSIYCGTDRSRNALIFPILIPFTVFVVALQVLVQGGILAYVSFIGPVELAERYLPIVTGLIAFGALIGCFQVLTSLAAFFKKPEHTQRAMNLDRTTYPALWDHVDRIALKISANSPDNIIVGLEPTFYATACKINLIGSDEELLGETLYLSLPLMRLFTLNELDAVIGHELGHFKAEDTNYSTKFSPVYANLSTALQNLSDTSSGASALAKIPAIVVLTAMYEAFEINISAISRAREFEADKVGCEASSKESLVYSLAKVSTYSAFWNQSILENIKRLNKGKVTTNLSTVFRESSIYNLGNRELNEIISEVLPSIIQHPTDSHPPLSERFSAMDFDETMIERELITKQGNSSEKLLTNIETLEEQLTVDEHRWCVALGLAKLPETEDESSIAHAIYSLAAGMIGADGAIENEEVKVAEDIGMQILPDDFDRVDFRNYINNLKDIPNFNETAEACKELSEDSKILIYNYLESIAKADNDFANEEKYLLVNLKKIWSMV
jgi:Zn-dependent protease with chaperone function